MRASSADPGDPALGQAVGADCLACLPASVLKSNQMKTTATLTPEPQAAFKAVLDLLAKHADQALSLADMDAHMGWERRYQTFSDTVRLIYGVELRPSE